MRLSATRLASIAHGAARGARWSQLFTGGRQGAVWTFGDLTQVAEQRNGSTGFGIGAGGRYGLVLDQARGGLGTA